MSPLSVDAWTERKAAQTGHARTPLAADGGRLRPALATPDILLQLWRAKWLMFLVFLPIVLLALAAALIVPVKYEASTRLLVRLPAEYVFDPVVGDAARGAIPGQDDVLQAEAELAHSPVIAERVIETIGLRRLYPRLAEAAGRARGARAYALEQRALEAFAKDFSASASPRSSILRMTFSHTDPVTAADTLNAFVAAYMAYRREVLAGQGADSVLEQRKVIEGRLKAADESLHAFLDRNGISDFDAELQASTRLYGDMSDQMAEVEALLREAEGRVAGLGRQISATPQTIDLYVEPAAEQELYGLRLEREKLLTRYRPDARVVQDIDRRILQIEAFMGTGPPGGLKRIGPNPTWQSLDAERAGASANSAALSARLAELSRQKDAAERRRRALAAIDPEYRRLVRERDALEASALTFATREQTERARSELAARSANSISVYEGARPPAKGGSPRRLIALAGVLLGLMTALAVGLGRAWSVRGLAGAGIAERTLRVRVLATASERGAA